MNRKNLILFALLIVALTGCTSEKPTQDTPPPRIQPKVQATATFEPTPPDPTLPAPEIAATLLIPTAAPDLAPTPTNRYPSPPRRAAERMQRIQQQVAELRGLPVLSRPRSYLVNELSLAQQFAGELSARQQPGEMEKQMRIFQALDLAPEDIRTEERVREIAVGGISGLYRAETDEIFVLGKALGKPERLTYAHEFSHALVDQYFDLHKLEQAAGCPAKIDRCLALNAVVEGEASLTAELWQIETQAGGENNPEFPEEPMAPPSGRAIDAPVFTLPLLQFPYSYGETFARTLYERGGWQAINAALANPPASSEQILHPEKYLAGEGPLPLAGPAPGSEWSVVADTALGEWMTFLMLAYSADAAARQPVEAAGRAAAGWGGDRVQVLQDPAGNTALAAHWIWDTSTDAAEFEQALRAFRALPEGNACRAANEQVDCFYTNGMEGLWLSAPDRETMDRLTTLYPQFAR